jgi:hypothetical protein
LFPLRLDFQKVSAPATALELPVITDFMLKGSVADPDRFGPDPDPTSENRPDPDSSK